MYFIESYHFGSIKINGKEYNSDLIIYQDKIDSDWWRDSSHKLLLSDIPDIIDAEPRLLIIGTGKYGLMKVKAEVKKFCKQKGITLFIGKTDNAVQKYNEVIKKEKVIAAFHLTC